MPASAIFTQINQAQSQKALFELACEYFQGQGFQAVIYAAPEIAAGPYTLFECGMSPHWMERYHAREFHLHDPIPGVAFRLGHPERLKTVLEKLPALNHDEAAFMDAFHANSGLTNGLLVPTYGPFGRPGLIGIVNAAHPALLDEMDQSLAAAVAQQIHVRMELLQIKEPIPGLSPKEREILRWLVKGKSVADIAVITGSKAPTVATHVQRIYTKLQVHDRVNCVAKALSRHYL